MADLVEQHPATADPVSAQTALIREYMAVLVAEGREAQHDRNGRELAIFERDFDTIARLVDALLQGNYRDVAARLAGVAPSSVRSWLHQADNGDRRHTTIAALVRLSEAIAEAETVRDVRAAGKDPRFWAAGMTFLERRHPEKWGRRQESTDGPKVAVYIGGRPTDVQVAVILPSAPAPSALPALGDIAADGNGAV